MLGVNDLSLLMLLSLRYCMGRRTYMPEHIRSLERAHHMLNANDLRTCINDIERDIDVFYKGDTLWSEHDRGRWIEFLDHCRKRDEQADGANENRESK